MLLLGVGNGCEVAQHLWGVEGQRKRMQSVCPARGGISPRACEPRPLLCLSGWTPMKAKCLLGPGGGSRSGGGEANRTAATGSRCQLPARLAH